MHTACEEVCVCMSESRERASTAEWTRKVEV